MGNKNTKKIYLKLRDKIQDVTFLDSEIIQEIESVKKKYKFNINYTYYDGNWTLLMCAVYHNRKELVEYILTFPNIIFKNKYGTQVLFLVQCVSVLILLLSRKDIDINIPSGFDVFINYACYLGRKEYVRELLVDARVNTSIRDKRGRTARDFAIRKGHHEITNMLKRTGCTPLLRIPNEALCRDITRMIIEEYV